MSDMQISTGMTMRISEAARDNIAAGIWFAVLAGALFLTAHGQSISMTAGLMLELTAAYSTFVLCGKAARSPFVHAAPYAFALAGAVFLSLSRSRFPECRPSQPGVSGGYGIDARICRLQRAKKLA